MHWLNVVNYVEYPYSTLEGPDCPRKLGISYRHIKRGGAELKHQNHSHSYIQSLSHNDKG